MVLPRAIILRIGKIYFFLAVFYLTFNSQSLGPIVVKGTPVISETLHCEIFYIQLVKLFIIITISTQSFLVSVARFNLL